MKLIVATLTKIVLVKCTKPADKGFSLVFFFNHYRTGQLSFMCVQCGIHQFNSYQNKLSAETCPVKLMPSLLVWQTRSVPVLCKVRSRTVN